MVLTRAGSQAADDQGGQNPDETVRGSPGPRDRLGDDDRSERDGGADGDGEPSIREVLQSNEAALHKVFDILAKFAGRLETLESGQPTAEPTPGVSRVYKRRIDEISGGVDQDARAPSRGQYGAYPSIDARYGHLDSKVRDAALAGTMHPASLPLLIPPNSKFWKANDADDVKLISSNGSLTLKASSKADPQYALSKFMAQLPTPLAFLVAWSHFTGLVAHGLGSPDDTQLCWTAMMWYGTWIADKAATHTWESVCRYHLGFHLERYQESFHASRWYRAVVTTATPSTTYARDRHLSRGRHVTYLGLENLDEGVDVG